MAKTIELTIPEPCHENWDTMTPVEKGRFCASCQKEVIDFTHMGQAELIAFFRKQTSGDICGRFYNDQLNNPLPLPVKRIPWAKYFFQITLPAFIASGKIMAQGKVVPDYKKNDAAITVVAGFAKLKDKPLSPKQITSVKGQVTDENGDGIPFATIINNKTKAGFAADSLGYFALQDVHLTEGSEYSISAVGYKNATMFASRINSSTPLIVKLSANNTLEGVTVTSYGSTRCGIRLGGAMTIIRTSITDNIKPLKKALPNDVLKIYPNPVQVNKNITLHFNNDTAGEYRYQILSIDGKLLTSGIKDCLTGNNILTLTIDNRFTAGTYILQLQNEAGSNKQSVKFIVQR